VRSILFVDQYSNMGGGQTVLLAMIESCLDHGWYVTLLAPGRGNLEKRLVEQFGSRVNFVDLYEMKMNSGRKTIGDIFKLIRGSLAVLKHIALIRSHNVVYINGARLFPIFGLLARYLSKKFFFHVHLDHSRAEKKLLAWIASSSVPAFIVLNSKFLYSRLVPSLRDNSKSLILLRYGLSKTFSKLSYVERFVEPTQLKAAVIGRIAPEKGQSSVLSVAKQLPTIRFDLIGSNDFQDGRYMEELKANKTSNVHFLGKSNDIIKTINDRGTNFSIVPSEWDEPFGLVSVESMALSLLTINSKRGGLVEIAEESGAAIFENDVQLTSLIGSYSQMPAEMLNQITKDQFTRTKEAFGWGKFDKAFQDCLNN
jgi:glycosyltransferase involved in cell wall biosynthesis